jgi:hypothetical protein
MLQLKTENKLGINCTGTNGSVNRVLTLINTRETVQNGFLVYASGLALLLDSEYSVDHKSSGTEITFLNRLWDDMTIVVQYTEDVDASLYDKMRNDLQDIILEHGLSATLIRQTETTNSMGDVSAVSEENYLITFMMQDISKKDRNIHEMGLAIPGNSKGFFYHLYPNAITGNGDLIVQVGDIIQLSDGRQWRIEEIISEHNAQANEIFRTGIIKKIDLDQ